jgi:hypothetical protein
LYEMRNIINSELIDKEFAFQVIGDKAQQWRTMDPATVKTNVDFVCESASRETNRAVQMQQWLGFLKIAPQLQTLGFPVRADIAAKLALENGFSVPQQTILQLLPTLKMEIDNNIDLGQMLAGNALLQFGMQGEMLANPGAFAEPGKSGETNKGGPEITQPLTEQDATQSAQQEAQPNVNQPV